ncbi:hypothetical protein Y1Q_0011460 [Alligator mississippiensis]|uniref:Uncharacterized protein n=1 Tax=Alligator mississippiensis TaxID=8496 RepID=A0A151LZX4_ALLMI|nr:hypothetical protein Y1Q_0011460 [Alligator mississippiensis]
MATNEQAGCRALPPVIGQFRCVLSQGRRGEGKAAPRGSIWVMLKRARKSLYRNALSATQLKKVECTRLAQIFGVYLVAKQDKLQDSLIQSQIRTKVSSGMKIH